MRSISEECVRRTRAHVVNAPRTELVAKTLRGGKSEVRDREAETVIETQSDVLGLQVVVINFREWQYSTASSRAQANKLGTVRFG